MARRRGGKPVQTNKSARTPTSRRQPEWVVLSLAGIGMAITAYLSWVAFSGETTAFCTEGSGCEVVQASRWASLFGLPITLWGFGVYALLALFAWTMAARLKRWRRLTFLALAGTAISVYLTVVGVIYLNAWCGWCLASLITITSIFVLLLFRRPASAPGMSWPAWALNGLIVTVILVGSLHAWQTDLLRPENPRLKALATHLEETGATYYGASWCPTCQEQNRLFGSSAHRLPFVECTPGGRGSGVAFECASQNIRSYPTWVINDQHFPRLMEPEELAEQSRFDWAGFDQP